MLVFFINQIFGVLVNLYEIKNQMILIFLSVAG